ncbi:HEAT repeat domain-containing protein [Nostoc sp. LEGE 12447]|uniref:HEAT repeat domain-containing protein n=1 Tax=Nostoc sp. LEGE 12447 TaxID=1828640 RepID=UPI0018836F91|nr:HEAT repeat domain-containing protein [Nostoc sp. LEGE 12447]MBE8998709.1 HEAT repeat domain-containing protein [Nostoc sp. LEGE 12447]
MLITPHHTNKISVFFLFCFTLLLTLFLSLPWVNAKETPKPKPQDWQINGILAALDDGHDQVKGYAFNQLLFGYDLQNLKTLEQKPDEIAKKAVQILKDKSVESNVRASAASTLGNLGEATKPYIKDIIAIIQDKSVESNVRANAAFTLGNLGETTKPYVKDIAAILQDKTVEVTVRAGAALALGNLGDTGKPYVKDMVHLLKDQAVDYDTGFNVILALGSLGEPAKPYVKDIIDFLKNKNTYSSSIYISYSGSRFSPLENLGDAAQPYLKDLADILTNKTADAEVHDRAFIAFGYFGRATQPYIRDILNLLKDESVDSSIRSRIASIFYYLGDAAKPYVKDIFDIFKDKTVNPESRYSAASILGQLGDAAKPYAQDIFEIFKDKTTTPEIRSSAASILINLGDAAKPYVKDIFDIFKDKTTTPEVRSSAVQILGKLGDAAEPYIKDIAAILKDKTVEISMRSSASEALGNLGYHAQPYIQEILGFIQEKNVGNQTDPENTYKSNAIYALRNLGKVAQPYIKDIINIIKDKSFDTSLRYSLASVSGEIEQLNLSNVVVILDNVYYVGQSDAEQWRFLTYFLGGGTEEVKLLLKWLGRPKAIPDKLTYAEGVKTLEVFRNAWKPSEDLARLREDLAKQIAVVARKVSWQPQDIVILETHYHNLKKAGYNEADSLESVIVNLKGWQWFFNARITIISHAAFWLALIFAYPKFPQIQAIFFWNPWVRRILGVGYVGFLLTWFSPFRRKLFEPFKPSLLADAGLDNFYDQSYFPESKVKVPTSGDILPITAALPSIQGQIILEGDSGLGKSMFLRHLLQNSQRIVVYLPAQKCHKGVIEAIQDKLHGQAQDADFLKNLIYSGAIDICIDGLNEVTAETRAKICQFVESYFRGNIIMTTQPLEWTPPSTAKTYYLQPLEQQQIQEFLISRQPRLPKDAKIQGADYTQACTNYLTEVLNHQQAKEELDAVRRILSNPMDLTVIALMLSQGKQPNLFRLQEQQYNLMAAEYQQEWKQEFPLKRFSAAVYQMRLEDKQALPADEFHQVAMSLEDDKYKMVVSRQWQDEKGEAKKEWYFRHDKIMDFFLVQNFLGETDTAEELLVDRMGDPRFRGVYFLLATLLPLDAAKELREKLIQYAADTKDNTVSNTFVQLLRTR